MSLRQWVVVGMFCYLFVDAEDGAPVEVEVTLGIAPRIKHDSDEAHYLV